MISRIVVPALMLAMTCIASAQQSPVVPIPPPAETGAIALNTDNEGWAVARALADEGIAAFVLKYRLRPTPADTAGFEAASAAMFSNAGNPAGRLKPDELVRDRQEQIADARAAFALV